MENYPWAMAALRYSQTAIIFPQKIRDGFVVVAFVLRDGTLRREKPFVPRCGTRIPTP
ncbi:MAG TPA: hypothetical protein VFA80_17585 [Xanthobacteraceae bacterium]|jgi:hypothetical protein|nr:hypothetical protein [Xanthobacteraceae bacterium]